MVMHNSKFFSLASVKGVVHHPDRNLLLLVPDNLRTGR